MAWYHKKHGHHQPKFSKLAVHGMPAAAGCKGGKLPRKKKNQSTILTDEKRVPLKCSQKINIGGNISNETPSNCGQSTTNYVSNSQVSNLTVPNLAIHPLPNYGNYGMPFSTYFQYPYCSSPPIGISGSVPNTMFSLPPSLPSTPITHQDLSGYQCRVLCHIHAILCHIHQ